jgi:hypothetical protein
MIFVFISSFIIIVLADIDGNGLEDIVGFGPNSLLVSFAAGDGTYSTPFSTVGGLGGTGKFYRSSNFFNNRYLQKDGILNKIL